MNSGSFTISLDFELFWGVRSNRNLEDYQENLLGVYEAIPKILALFEKYDIHATWATVGFLFHENIEEIKLNRPKVLPNYKNIKVDPYLYLEGLKSQQSENFSKMHCSLDLIKQIGKSPNQEIATHTYSHFFTYEPLTHLESFSVDIQKAINIALRKGYPLKSLVFPRNQMDKHSIKNLDRVAIESYRGNPDHWVYSKGDRGSKSFFLRFYRLLDTYLNISGHHTTRPTLSEGAVELKASMMLRPYLPKLSYLEFLKLRRIKKAMKEGALENRNFHLWWHPHNFGINKEKNLKNLEEILIYFKELQTKHNMSSLTMDELKNILVKDNIPKTTIAIVSNTSWNIYNFRLGLIEALRKEGYRVVIVAPRDEYSKKLEAKGFSFYDIKINNKGVNPFEDLFLIRDFYKLYQKINPHIVLNYTIKPNIYSSFAGKSLGIPVINNITGLGTVFLNSNPSSYVARWLYRLSLDRSSVVFQNGDDMKLFLDKKIVKEERVTLIAGSGIDTDYFKSREKSLEKRAFTFLMITRLIKDKGVEEYIDAIRMIRASEYGSRCSFKILGSLYLSNPTAISKEMLNSWIEEGIIEYLGHSDHVKEEIDKVDVVVLPSYREGLSRVLLEAGSMEKAIITTDVPGCRDVVDDGINGYLVKVKSSIELSEAMKKMVNLSKDELDSMGKKGREKVVNNFSQQKVIDKYMLLINQIKKVKQHNFRSKKSIKSI
jgi:glycosyltransferase involved in cell wall biosynthesis/peptidoglycan/xylan/chitin deacetylase (PgdA/CDA1 family)